MQMNPQFIVFAASSAVFFAPPVMFGEIVKMMVPSEFRTFFSVRCG